MTSFGKTAFSELMSTYFQPSLVDLGSMLRFAKGRNEAFDKVVPIPEGWKFIEENKQLQLAISKKDLTRFKLIFD